jgi:predicted Zn-ribbon and HTH transcriptional regulator
MPRAKCQRCGLEKETNYDNEKCPKCGAYTRHMPIWINGTFI